MDAISEKDIRLRIERDNPWWSNPQVKLPEADYQRRVYFQPFRALALNFDVKRGTILLGPRRVGKTVIIRQLISDLIAHGTDPKSILYASIDAPIYSGISLEKFLEFMPGGTENDTSRIVIFDEIQYLRDWEVHMKDLVDNHPASKFIASGSAAAALRLQSRESGAGRFSDFMLPPLTFYEFLRFTGDDEKLISHDETGYVTNDINALNARFIDYLNFGGYPEAVFNEAIRSNPEQFIKNDIIDKVLLKDMPSLYGITAIQELNKLFSFLAYNAGNEASLENISRESGLFKPTIKKYIEYLENAFLIIKLQTVDDNCRTMKRERNFKIYLNNPSMRAALFGPVSADDGERIGHLAESAVFSQWQHSNGSRQLRYSRWRNEGEVDVVYLDPSNEKPLWAGEIKWSDKHRFRLDGASQSIQTLLIKHSTIRSAFMTTKTMASSSTLEGRPFRLVPTALYCYGVGRNITSSLENLESGAPHR